jgi:Tfp pilus assembly protein PilN
MTTTPALNLNLATRPLRNRRLYKTIVWILAGLMAVCALLGAYVFLKYGGEARRLKSAGAEARRLQAEAQREERRLDADIKRAEGQSRMRVDLVNAIILKKSFRWTALFSELEKALPGPSFITALSPAFTADGSVAMHIRVTSRSLEDLSALITNLAAGGFKDIKVGGEQRSDDGRLIAEIDLRYERAL